MENLLRLSPIPSFVWRRDGQHIVLAEVNEAAKSLLKGKYDWHIGMAASKLYSNFPEIVELLRECFSQMTTIVREIPYMHQLFKCTFVPPDLILVHVEDISEIKQIEKKRQQEKDVWEQAFDLIPDLVAIIDTNYKIIRANKAFAENSGIAKDQCPGKKCYKLLHGTQKPPKFCPHYKLMKDKCEHKVEFFEKKLKGYYLLSASPIFDTRGELIGSIHIARDITELKQTEKRLKQKITELNSFLDNIPDMAWVKDIKCRYVAVNKEFCQWVKMDKEALLNHTSEICFEADKAKRFIEDDLRIMQSKQRILYEEKFIDSENNATWFETIKSPVIDESGKVVGTVGISHDITRRKQAEQLLRESEQKYRRLIELAPDAILTINSKGIITSCNTASVSESGFSKEEIVGKHFTSLTMFKVHNNLHYIKILRSLLKNKKVKPFEIKWIRKDGAIRTSEVHICVIKKDNKFAGFQAIARDITERNRMEQEVRAAKERYQFLYEQTPLMYFTVDTSGRILSVNKFGAEQLGYSVNELIGQSIINTFVEQNRGEALKKLFSNPQGIIHSNFRKVRKDGSTLWVETIARQMEDIDGKKVLLIVCNDITEKIKSQHERERLIKKLAEAEKLATLGQFTAGVAHEINNPLHIIIAKIFFLQSSYDNDPALLTHIKSIEKQVNRIKRLARDILNYAKPNAIVLSPIDINNILLQAIKSLSDYMSDNIKIETVLAPELPMFLGDPIGLEIVFKNMILNSIEAIEDSGKIVITNSLKNNKNLEISISDTGKGIKEHDLHKVFEPFFTTKRKMGGTGLGLAICKQIIKQHSGTIEVKSKINEGTIFTINLKVNLKL